MATKKTKWSVDFPKFVDILGTPWRIVIKKYEDDPYFRRKSACGYCQDTIKEIAVCEEKTWPGCEEESDRHCISAMKHTLRHEIVHAFFHESGLGDSSGVCSNSWSQNEEMVDWIALQGPKIFKAWQETGCIETMDPEIWMQWQKFKEGNMANE